MYFIISFILLFLSYFEFYLNKKYLFRITITFIVGLLFFILLGCNTFSPDLDNYKIHFEDLDQDYIKLRVEPFILFLMETCKNLGLSFQGYQLVFSFLTFSLFLYSIFKYSPLPVFVLFNFFFIPFFPDITQIRFFLGFTIFLFSLQFFKKKKLVFYILIVLAFLCHLSIFMMLIFLILRNFKFFRRQVTCNIIIIVGTCLLGLTPKSIIDPLLVLVDPKLLLYAESEIVGTFAGTIALFLPFFIINNIVIYFHNKYSSVYYPLLEEKYVKNIPLFIDLIQFSNFMILFQYFIRDFSRITQNIHIIVIVYLSIIIYAFIKSKKRFSAKLIVIGVIFCNLSLFYIQFLMVNNFEYFEVINKTFTSNYFFDSIAELFNFENL
ncbi:EpsG family protein [Flavobacterium sp. 11]|uniref:EpsG family protein n=1 Tax=Flavobacterium sp. 11 TaxID=357523 RepID=UPI000C198A67|nr:EpsG family protein [Flavobacterium sp. 11]PIF60668.1 EpsG-like putative glucosyltransferase [Flavobacterium sp. 11]